MMARKRFVASTKKVRVRSMTTDFMMAARLRYVSSGGDYDELSMFQAQNQDLWLRQSPSWTVDKEVEANVAINDKESRIDAVPDDNDDWYLEGALRRGKVESMGVKR